MTLLERDQANIKKGRSELLYELVANGDIDADTAARKMNSSLSEFLASMEAAGFKVPAGKAN